MEKYSPVPHADARTEGLSPKNDSGAILQRKYSHSSLKVEMSSWWEHGP